MSARVLATIKRGKGLAIGQQLRVISKQATSMQGRGKETGECTRPAEVSLLAHRDPTCLGRISQLRKFSRISVDMLPDTMRMKRKMMAIRLEPMPATRRCSPEQLERT